MLLCPFCGSQLKHRDYVMRIVKYGGKRYSWIIVERTICPGCYTVRRLLPNDILPYKHYAREVIEGFVSGKYEVEDDSLIFEDYPCEMTIARWRRSHKLQAFI